MAKLTTIIVFLLVSFSSYSQVEVIVPEETKESIIIGEAGGKFGTPTLATLYKDGETAYTLGLSTHSGSTYSRNVSINGSAPQAINVTRYKHDYFLINFNATPEELEQLYTILKDQVNQPNGSKSQIKIGKQRVSLETTVNLGIRSLDFAPWGGGRVYITSRQLDKIFGK